MIYTSIYIFEREEKRGEREKKRDENVNGTDKITKKPLRERGKKPQLRKAAAGVSASFHPLQLMARPA